MNDLNINHDNTKNVVQFKNTHRIQPNDDINLISEIERREQRSHIDQNLSENNTSDGLNLLSNPHKMNNDMSRPVVNDNIFESDSTNRGNFFSRKSSEHGQDDDDDDDDSGEHNFDVGDDDDDDDVEEEMSYEDIMRDKQDLLFKLHRLEKLGFRASKQYTMANDLNEMRHEYERLKYMRDIEKSVKFQRKMLMMFTSGIEYLNGKFDPLNVKLDGWSEGIYENITDYDEVFEELHEKYDTKIKVAPELRLMMMVGGSAFTYHLTNTLFKSQVPDMNTILRDNPDIRANLQKAAMNNMNAQSTPDDPIMNMMSQDNDGRQRTTMGMGDPIDNIMGLKQNKPNMNGPSGVDDILNQLDNSRVETMSDIDTGNDSFRNIDIMDKNRNADNAPQRRRKIIKPTRQSRNTINFDNL
jgi:hypothetical protein